MTTVAFQPPPFESADARLTNADLAPTTDAQRRWSVWAFAALWVSMSACIPTYKLAASLVTDGMNWWQAVVTIFAGSAVVLVPMVLNGWAGTQHGIPFPVYCRASFGTAGANLPAMLRAVIACGWFGIQTWIGGTAVLAIAVRVRARNWGDPKLLPSDGAGDHAGRSSLAFMPPFGSSTWPSFLPGSNRSGPAARRQGPAADRAGGGRCWVGPR